MKKAFLLLCAVVLGTASVAQAELTVTTVHPILTDVARQIGGSQVTVIELMRAGDDVHHFEPSSSDVTKIREADILLASGKGLELYLPKLQKSLGKTTKVVQAGNAVRSIKVDPKSAVFVCCPAHSAGSIDPHWWHSISGMKQAVDYVAKEFGKADRANAKTYQNNASAYKAELDELNRWAKREIATIPRSNRILVTSHAAFGYFCKEFGFRSIPVAGLEDGAVSSQYLAEAIEAIQKHNVLAVFPEKNANPQALASIVSATGAKKGRPLVADASSHSTTTYDAFIRHNVGSIVAALGK